MQIIKNIFRPEEVENIKILLSNEPWALNQQSNRGSSEIFFWKKELINSELKSLFYNKITKSIKHSILINELYLNGQSFGQCGFWHVDNSFPNDLTFVFFIDQWLPEYGGHLMIQTIDNIVSILPEFNTGILFNSNLKHMALSPSRHCPKQRESIACKFKLL